tara:strand:- start:713 stop:1849 length:1137 start_codon:yes stop_codon:yes gene_type:complete
MKRNRKVYKPSAIPTYKGGGKTSYSTKGYDKVQENNNTTSKLTKHNWLMDALGLDFSDLLDMGLDVLQYSQQSAALNEMLEDVEDPSQVVQGTTEALNLIPDSSMPTPSTAITDLIGEVKGQQTDVEIDDSALEIASDASQQATADSISNISKMGTKGMAGLTNVLEAADKTDLGIAQQGLDIAKTETQLTEQAEQNQMDTVADLTNLYGQQDFSASQDLFSTYIDDLSAASQFKQQLELGAAGLSLPGVISGNLAKEGMKTPEGEATMEEGKEVMEAGEPEISPGEEKHETNPIDLVKDGKKIGEMTGGEVIMPSKDVEVLEALLKKGDSENIMKMMGVLMMKWNKKAQEHAEKEIGGAVEAKGGAKVYKPSAKVKY